MLWLGEREIACCHEDLCPAQAGDTNDIKSVFKLDNVFDILAEMPNMKSFSPLVVHLQTVTL